MHVAEVIGWCLIHPAADVQQLMMITAVTHSEHTSAWFCEDLHQIITHV